MVKLNELEQRIAGIERVVRNQSQVDLAQQVRAMERRDDMLQGQIEELAHDANTTAERQRELFRDLDARLQGLEASVGAVAAGGVNVLDGGQLSPGQLPVPGGSDRDNYQAALELLRSERYEPAAMAFGEFLKTYPDSDLADNAQYWLAEAHYVTQKFETALGEFNTVIEQFPDSQKVPDALLKIGYCNYELQRWDAARTALQRVQSEYPETTAARLSEQRLQRMQEEGN